MRTSLARHDAIMRQSIAGANGHVFKTVGDAFCAAFSTAPEAIEAVLAAQIALQAEPWPPETPIKVHMAIHTGSVEHRDNDYFGPPINRVARLLATGHGGQALLSHTTFELVRHLLPEGVTLRDLGSHVLKGLAQPEQVYQVQHPELLAGFPPLRSLDNPNLRHNLPPQVSSFIGRTQERTDITSLLEKTRLLTLTGSGGCGKTRLALYVAAELTNASISFSTFLFVGGKGRSFQIRKTARDRVGIGRNPRMCG